MPGNGGRDGRESWQDYSLTDPGTEPKRRSRRGQRAKRVVGSCPVLVTHISASAFRDRHFLPFLCLPIYSVTRVVEYLVPERLQSLTGKKNSVLRQSLVISSG